MAEASIPVDLFNPGQVFACIGFAEAADTLLGNAEGAFDWSDRSQARFWLRARGEESPVARVLRFLDGASAVAEAPTHSPNIGLWKGSWGRVVEVDRSQGYSIPDPQSPATLVCALSDERDRLVVDYWGDGTSRDSAKFWGGAGGQPGAALARDALALTHGRALAMVTDPFMFTAPQSSSFRLDWRRDYIPIDAGFSLNEHTRTMQAAGFPVVELLAAIGLTNARPARGSPRGNLDYVYGIAGGTNTGAPTWLPLSFHRAALGGSTLPFPTRRFRMLLNWPGQEGQARSITTVTEETSR